MCSLKVAVEIQIGPQMNNRIKGTGRAAIPYILQCGEQHQENLLVHHKYFREKKSACVHVCIHMHMNKRLKESKASFDKGVFLMGRASICI